MHIKVCITDYKTIHQPQQYHVLLMPQNAFSYRILKSLLESNCSDAFKLCYGSRKFLDWTFKKNFYAVKEAFYDYQQLQRKEIVLDNFVVIKMLLLTSEYKDREVEWEINIPNCTICIKIGSKFLYDRN